MITIIDYEDSNSIELGECIKQLTDDFVISKSEIDICRANKIIFPGSGTAQHAMKRIHILNLFSVIRIIRKPILGIGLGMQLMADYSLEGNISCLGIFSGTSQKFNNEKMDTVNEGMQVVLFQKESKLFAGIENKEKFFFHHTYYLPLSELTTSTSKHNVIFSASIEKNGSFGVQFHPEKSGDAGLKLLDNFIKI
ncbi:MAG: imidazole glycerol phosphate synthase subunit HisH [Ignavibacteria bacterium]|nr:imidazole glycerol phosphate synthase subunit HisH [Ignavibacteria bacterium]MBT8381107.1 imidazole glycerol phosphate synthase subunit HisH [Ignavibacteria bacterium]MBT8392143.1 imidazole glycerol phosphate synthase subunit HisH [Ignavibacteria bacterium]NNL21415.1 imidazole glycerol phosphate synthase subunit HisH [Ignavibacteriaceae bacterium]